MSCAAAAAANHSSYLVSDLCTSLRGIETDIQDCWSPSRKARLVAERSELVAEMRSRGFEVEG